MRRFPILARFAIWLIVPLVVAIAAAALHLKRSVPSLQDDLTVSWHGASARIARDRVGVAYITAQSDDAAFFALGYVHAQDRMWQLEVQRRFARGELSEVFGVATLSQDAWIRTLGLYEAAKSSWSDLSEDSRASLTAYTAGINAWLETNPVMPAEFFIFDLSPHPWTEIDSLAWAKMFALDLAANLRHEIMNTVATQYLDSRQMRAFSELHTDADSSLNAQMADAARALSRVASFEDASMGAWGVGGRFVGSNAWVVAGWRTKGGAPILANDTHLNLSIPSPWYAASLNGKKLAVKGMTLVGLPLVIFGANRHIAWGGTNLMADVQDLSLEELHPERPNQYRTEDGWKAVETRVELITVKADFPSFLRSTPAPERVLVRRTRNGPIVSDVLGRISSTEQPVSLRWTALDPDDTSYGAFFALNYAENWQEFNSALKLLVAPTLNVLYADEQGNIGSVAAGRVPLRQGGKGSFPVQGWNEQQRWIGFVPFEEMPRSYNPKEGYIVSANHDLTTPDYKHFISRDWAPPYRAKRIQTLLEQPNSLSPTDMTSIQADVTDESVSELLAFLQKANFRNTRQQEALGYLANWDRRMSTDSQAAAIFYVWVKYLRDEVFTAKIAKHWNKLEDGEVIDGIIASASYDDVLRAMTDSSQSWCETEARPAPLGPCSEEIENALDRAIDELTRLQGFDMSEWRWGHIHVKQYRHRPLSELRMFAPLFERRLDSGGSPNTINVANAEYRKADGYVQTRGASFRQVIEVGGISSYLFQNSSGQSGNLLSVNYDDLSEMFDAFEYRELEMSYSETRSGEAAPN